MDAKTAEALEASIIKWELIKNKKPEALGARTCPLCLMFHPNFTDGGECDGCPVKQKTQVPYCRKTPYNLASAALDFGTDAEWKIAAQEEIDFLISLREPEAAK